MIERRPFGIDSNLATPLSALALTALAAGLYGVMLSVLDAGIYALALPLILALAAVILVRPEIGLVLMFLSAPLETTYLDLGARIKPQHVLGIITMAGWALQLVLDRQRAVRGTSLNIALFMMILAALISFIFNSQYISMGSSLFLLQLWFVAVIFLMANFADRPDVLKRCFWAFVAAGALEAVYAIIQAAGFYHDADPSTSYGAVLQGGRPFGTFSEPDFFAPFLIGAFLLLLPFWGNRRLGSWRTPARLALLLVLTASMLAMVRASWLGLLAGLAAFAWLKLSERGESQKIAALLKHAAGVLAAAGAIALVLAWVSPTAFSTMTTRAKNLVAVVEPENPHPTRAREIGQTWSVIKGNAITGAGIGTFAITTEYGRRIASAPDHARAGVVGSGTPLSLLHDEGVIGLLAFVSVLGVLFWRLLGTLRTARPEWVPYLQGVFIAVVGLTVSSLFNNLFYFGFYWLVIALAAALTEHARAAGGGSSDGRGADRKGLEKRCA